MSIIPLCIAVAALALAFALIIGIKAWSIGSAIGLLDHPDTDGGRKRHAKITPLVGGIAVTGAAVGAALVSYFMSAAPAPAVLWLAAVVAAMFLIGALDDKFHLSPVLRLGAAFTVLVLVVNYAPDFSLAFLGFAGQPAMWLLGSWGSVFTLLCLLGLLNAVNMADGKNGIVIGLSLIWTLVLAMHAPLTMIPVLVATGAALLVMGGFNMANRLFLGDGGGYALSALFGLLAIYTYNHDFETMRADDVAVMFAIPVFDTVRLMVVRVSRRRSPFEGDRDHLHHHLHARIGWPHGLWVYLAMVAVPNAGAIAWPGTGLVWLAVSLLIYVTVMIATQFPAAVVDVRPAE